MRKPVLLIFTNALILVVIFVLLAQSLFVITRIAQAQTTTGEVLVQRGGTGDWAPLQTGESVAHGDVVKTGKNGEAAFAFADGTRWKLSPGSQFTLQKAAVDTLQKREESLFFLASGKVSVRLAKKLGPQSHFRVGTPGFDVRARSAVFDVKLEGAHTTLECARGSVEVHDKTQNRVVQGGQALSDQGGKLHLKTASRGAMEGAMLRPRLETEIVQNDKIVILRGQTEAGGTLSLDGKAVPVLANGAFFQPIKTSDKPRELWIVARDIFGEESRVCQTAVVKNDKLEVGSCE